MKVNENNFVSMIRLGREEGILYVIEEFGGLLQCIVKSRLYHAPDRIEECMNDIFLGIWKNIDSFDEKKGSFKNWAAGVARLEAIDTLRKIQREQVFLNLEDVEVSREDAGLQNLVEQELSEETESLLACLSPKDRELFYRLYVAQEDVGQAARAMDMSDENVYVRVYRGRKKIRASVRERKGI